MTSSMTGFGHSRHINKETEIYCEIKSVNHRFLDISIKPNDISSELDLFIRDAISKKVKRGTLDIRLKLKFPSSNSYIINKDSLRNLSKSIDEVKLLEIKKLTFSDIKDIPGIIKTEQKIQVNQSLIKKVFKEREYRYLLPQRFNSINIDSQAGDVIIWNLRTCHSANALRVKYFKNLSIRPSIENLLEKYFPQIFLPRENDRAVIFSDFGKMSEPLINYIKDNLRQPGVYNPIKNSNFLVDEIISKSKKLGLNILDIRKYEKE